MTQEKPQHITEENLHHMRKEYSPIPLDREKMEHNPFVQFANWFKEALEHETTEVNSMVVATSSKIGQPHARYVLLKSYSQEGFVFFTNYNSNKGKDIEHNNKISLLFFWPNTMRQIRIEGTASKVPAEDSDLYFDSRPRESQASSALSQQSNVLKDRAEFDRAVTMLETSNEKIIRPNNWGGYLVKPHLFEFWQGGIGRSHDRFVYSHNILPNKKSYEQQCNDWVLERLYP